MTINVNDIFASLSPDRQATIKSRSAALSCQQGQVENCQRAMGMIAKLKGNS